MSEKRTGAKFTYSIKAPSGFRSKMEGTLRGPEHHGVVSAAANGDFVDDFNMLSAAPDLLKMLKVAQLWLDVDGRFDMQGINAAIAKAEGLAPNQP